MTIEEYYRRRYEYHLHQLRSPTVTSLTMDGRPSTPEVLAARRAQQDTEEYKRSLIPLIRCCDELKLDFVFGAITRDNKEGGPVLRIGKEKINYCPFCGRQIEFEQSNQTT